jgi:molybdopterin biosynthesis enzyme
MLIRHARRGLPCAAEDLDHPAIPLDALTSALASDAAHDIIVTTGGASVGDHDLVARAGGGRRQHRFLEDPPCGRASR